MHLKPQDVVIALSLFSPDGHASYAEKAERLGMSASEVHAAERRLAAAGLVEPESGRVNRRALVQFLVHGVPYAYAVSPGEVTRGIPTAWAAPAFKDRFASSNDIPPVWPDPSGTVRGCAVQPLYRSVPKAIQGNPGLYALLSLVDALRIGRARDRKIAEEELNLRLKENATA